MMTHRGADLRGKPRQVRRRWRRGIAPDVSPVSVTDLVGQEGRVFSRTEHSACSTMSGCRPITRIYATAKSGAVARACLNADGWDHHKGAIRKDRIPQAQR
jgi:hypothetical protein